MKQLPNCRYAVVDGGNHHTFLLQDNPPVLPFIEEFLQEVVVESIMERAR
ncbi:MAG: hypothetical protein ACE5H0_08875 [Bacteroidota bacterium]